MWPGFAFVWMVAGSPQVISPIGVITAEPCPASPAAVSRPIRLPAAVAGARLSANLASAMI